MRGVGELELIREFLPEIAVSVAAIVTHAGDYSVVIGVGLIAWAVGRDREPWPVVAVLAAIGLTTVLKSAIGLTRPPGAAIGGYGFPSGHALGATVAYGLAADRLEIGSRRTRVAAATIVVGIVAASRVAIGVHYPIDVVAGLLLGLGVLAVVRRVWSADSSPTEATDIEVHQSILEAEGDQIEGGDSR